MRTLILATDFSEAALNAAQYAASLTNQISVSRLILYHSCFNQMAAEVPLADEQYYLELKEKSIGKLNELKTRLVAFVAPGVTIDCFVNMSSLQEAVCVEFLKDNPELVVMGATGRGKVKERIFGSQAAMAARQTRIPLLLVPLGTMYKEVKRVVLAWDMKDSLKTFPKKLFKNFLQALNVELLIVNVDYHNKQFSADTIGEQSFMHDFLDSEKVKYFYENHWDVSKGIMAFASEYAADWVIVVPKKERFPDNIFKLSTTRRLTFHSKIALLILPPAND